MTEGKKIGLALGSGSARGWAHIGVIRALAKAGIGVDYVAGTSIGALVGATYAVGKIDTLEDIVLQLDWKRVAFLFDLVFPKSGLIDGKKVSDFVRSHVQEKLIEELPLPFCAVCTDLAKGCEVILRDGDLIEAIRASISVPGIFTPVRRNGAILVDGGLVNPVPVSAVRQMGADFVIAVDLNHGTVKEKMKHKSRTSSSKGVTHRRIAKESRILEALNKAVVAADAHTLSRLRQWLNSDPLPNIFEVLEASINIMEVQITTARLKTEPPDILIQPNLGHIRFPEFYRAREAIAEGYWEAKTRIETFVGKKL